MRVTGESFFLGNCGQNVLEFLVEDDVLDQDICDLDSPFVDLPGYELSQL
jgi:hypothetical protein